MEKITYLDHQGRSDEGRQEALKWLSRRLKWEERLGELRPGATAAKQAA